MANDPAFLFYPGDYLRDTQCLSEASQVAYDRIMCEHMRNICISQAQLDFFTKRLTIDQKSEVMMILRPADGGFCIPWVVESITKRREYSESRRKNRSSTKEKDKKISKSYVPHMDNENEIEIENEIVITDVNAKFITIENEKVFNVLPILEFYEAALNGRQKEQGTRSWKDLVPEWFEQNLEIAFNDQKHVFNSFSKYMIGQKPKNGTVVKKLIDLKNI